MQVAPVILLLVLIGLTLIAGERLARVGWLSLVLARKFVHLVAVAAVAISPLFFTSQWLLTGIMVFFTGLLIWAVGTNRLAIDEQRHRKSWGIAIFPLAFLLLWIAFGRFWPWLVIYPMLVLAIADPAAALVGELMARRYWQLTGDRKSWAGSFAFFVVGAFTLLFLPGWLKYWHPMLAWPLLSIHHGPTIAAILMVTAVAALAEALGSGGMDNLSIPLVTAWGMAAAGDTAMQVQLLPAAGMALIFALIAYWRGWLDAGGAATSALMGVMVWTTGGWQMALPLLLFFITGSLLGKLPRKMVADAKQGRARDWVQVLANGGIVMVFMWLHAFLPSPAWILAAWVSVTVSLSDTWSSEIGQWAGGKVVDVIGFSKMPAGLSGGISWQGTLGGLVGAILLALVGKWALALPGSLTILIAAAGFLGMLLDSILGSIFQARYRHTDGKLSDIANEVELEPEKGLRWMTNDAVNLISNFLATLIAMLLLLQMDNIAN